MTNCSGSATPRDFFATSPLDSNGAFRYAHLVTNQKRGPSAMHHRTRPEWTIILTVPKPRPLSPRWRALLRAGLFSLSLGLNLGVGAALAHGAPAASEADACEDYAALHYEMSGGLDSAWEDAHAACAAREGSLAQAAYWADQCQSETSWALYLPESDTWRAECGDADGNRIGAP